MFHCSPAAFIGEFDVEVGPKMKYVSEYFSGKQMCPTDSVDVVTENDNETQIINFVCGEALMGSYVATGNIQPDCDSFLSLIASRVLTALTNKEEDVINFFRESPDSPAVASISFCLADVFARGQRTRFCIAFIHDSDDALLSMWPLLQNFTSRIIDVWKKRCAERRVAECSLAGNGHGHEPRCFANLVSPSPSDAVEKEKELEGLLEVHSFFESLFPIAFSSPLDSLNERNLLRHGEQLEVRMKEAISAAILVEVEKYIDDQVRVSHNSCWSLFGCWALEFLAVPSKSALYVERVKKLQLIVFCLLCGVQIAVSGRSSTDTAKFVFALERLLPRSNGLNSICFANSYISPRKCCLISFSNEYLESTSILPFDSSECINRTLKKRCLDTRHSGFDVLHVSIRNHKLVDVALYSPENRINYGLEMSTVSSRVVHLIQKYSIKYEEGLVERIGLRARDLLGLHAEIYQVILEYYVKGEMICGIMSPLKNSSNCGRLPDTQFPLVKGEIFQCFVQKDASSYAHIRNVGTPK